MKRFSSMINLMSDGKKCQVVLLDDRRLDILIQPKLTSADLLDMVASHFNLKEKEYFGLCFLDETQHPNWLLLERRVLDHDLPKNPRGPLTLYFAVRFFVESISCLRNSATIEVFYLQAKSNIFKGVVDCDPESAFELAAHSLQATHGDYTDDEAAKNHLKKLPLLPTSALREHPSIQYCEDQVIGHYKKLAGQTRGLSIVNYLNIVEGLPTYGIHYYEVKDKNNIPWWLGLSWKGIAQYDHNDKRVPRRVFPWRQLENLYFRDRKFSIEYHDPKRVSVSRRTFGPSNVSVYAWLTATSHLTKNIWSMAVAQHQFYLDRKQSKVQLPSVRSMSEIAADISQSTSSLTGSVGSGDLHRADSTPTLTHNNSMSSTKIELSIEEIETQRAAQREMFTALKARKDILEEQLRKKTKELLEMCLKEGEITGFLPLDTPLAPGEPVPQVRKRVGTAFSLDRKMVQNRNKMSREEEELAKLELEYDLQKQITQAAKKLAEDRSIAKNVRKQRRQNYNRSLTKLKDIEKRLREMRIHTGKPDLKKSDKPASPANSPAVGRHHIQEDPQSKVSVTSLPQVEIVEVEHQRRSSSSSRSSHRSVSPPGGGSAHQRSRGLTPSPVPARAYHSKSGYTTSPVHSTRTQYRNQMYPTFSSRSQSVSSNQSEYDNLHSSRSYPAFDTVSQDSRESGSSSHSHNLYNVNTLSTSRYDSIDDLKTPTNVEPPYDLFQDERLRAKHESLERQSRHSQGHYQQRYGSLERNSGHHQLPHLMPSKFGSKRDSKDFESIDTYERERYDNDRTPTHTSPYDNSQQSPLFRYDDPRTTRYNYSPASSESGYVSRQVAHTSKYELAKGQYNDPRSPEGLRHTSSDSSIQPRLDCDENRVRRNSKESPRYNPYDQRVFEKPTPVSGDGKRYDSPRSDSYPGIASHGTNTQFDKNSTLYGENQKPVISPYGDPAHVEWVKSLERRRNSPPAIKPVGPRLGQYESELKNPHYESPLAAGAKIALNVSTPSSEVSSAESPQPIISVTKYQTHVVQEVSKPYELSDYYKYSEKIRRHRSQDDSASSSSGDRSNIDPYAGPLSPPSVVDSEGSRPCSPFSMFASSPLNEQPPPGALTSPVHSKTVKDRVPHSIHNAQSTPLYQQSPSMSRRTPAQKLQCESVQNTPGNANQGSITMSSQRATPLGDLSRLQQSCDGSFSFDAEVADGFSEEMLAWYDDKKDVKPATLV